MRRTASTLSSLALGAGLSLVLVSPAHAAETADPCTEATALTATSGEEANGEQEACEQAAPEQDASEETAAAELGGAPAAAPQQAPAAAPAAPQAKPAATKPAQAPKAATPAKAPAAAPKKPAVAPAVSGDKDCRDFPDHASAQAFYVEQGGPAQDPHRLDGNNDGVACEAWFGVDGSTVAVAVADRSQAKTINSGIPAGPDHLGLAGGALLLVAGAGVGLRAARSS